MSHIQQQNKLNNNTIIITQYSRGLYKMIIIIINNDYFGKAITNNYRLTLLQCDVVFTTEIKVSHSIMEMKQGNGGSCHLNEVPLIITL